MTLRTEPNQGALLFYWPLCRPLSGGMRTVQGLPNTYGFRDLFGDAGPGAASAVFTFT